MFFASPAGRGGVPAGPGAAAGAPRQGPGRPDPDLSAAARRERRAVYSRPLLGRVEERRKLGNSLRALQGGQGGAVIVQGEAGIGTSHLLAGLVEQARLAGVRISPIWSKLVNRLATYGLT